MRLGCCGILTEEEDGPKRLCDSSASISGSSSVSNVLRKEADARPISNKKNKIFEKKCCMIELKLLYTYKVLYMVST